MLTKDEEVTPVDRFPDLGDPVVLYPDHAFNPFTTQGGNGTSGHRFTLLKSEERWHWTHVLRAVTGWEVIAAGSLSATTYPTLDDAATLLTRKFLGPKRNGDGFDRLGHEAYVQRGRTAHLPCGEGEPQYTYCGATGSGPAEFNTREAGHVQQHCIACDRAYRAAHYGRTPVTEY